ncbi:hypothetical protein MELA_01812 [Candidatus Methylomirabilis lanthanidiphila]|uniref:Uncharacterized protein n=1 Tax=Candidatus Methylomirabilis lanthanidiphila TaxID=2211376 RepID=A0A564ZLK0_9BACT|nr:hypothetical protein [Candidatus Methylomirabilis lanthanidiphila]VUZ85428.1 hypothetical protein MELA_01812 [Candidatus Methylomirabilis lanthanidiphila]
MNSGARIAIVDAVCDVEQSEQPFGKRWRQEEVVLNAEHLAALREGKILALDVQEEYVMFVKLDPAIAANLKELGYGG